MVCRVLTCCWNGKIGEDGVSYVGGKKKLTIVNKSLTYEQLLEKMYDVTCLSRKQWELNLLVRVPTFHCKLDDVPIDDDEAVHAMFLLADQKSFVATIYLDAKPINPPRIVSTKLECSQVLTQPEKMQLPHASGSAGPPNDPVISLPTAHKPAGNSNMQMNQCLASTSQLKQSTRSTGAKLCQCCGIDINDTDDTNEFSSDENADGTASIKQLVENKCDANVNNDLSDTSSEGDTDPLLEEDTDAILEDDTDEDSDEDSYDDSYDNLELPHFPLPPKWTNKDTMAHTVRSKTIPRLPAASYHNGDLLPVGIGQSVINTFSDIQRRSIALLDSSTNAIGKAALSDIASMCERAARMVRYRLVDNLALNRPGESTPRPAFIPLPNKLGETSFSPPSQPSPGSQGLVPQETTVPRGRGRSQGGGRGRGRGLGRGRGRGRDRGESSADTNSVPGRLDKVFPSSAADAGPSQPAGRGKKKPAPSLSRG